MKEVWKPIPGWKDYEASSLGRVRRILVIDLRGNYQDYKILKPSTNKRNSGPAYYVNLYDREYYRKHRRPRYKSKSVGVLILLTFKGPRPPGKEACHKDDVPSHNLPSNLYWGTPKQNRQDASRNRCLAFGPRNRSTKLTARQVKYIRRTLKIGSLIRGAATLGRKLGVKAGAVLQAARYQTWRHVQ